VRSILPNAVGERRESVTRASSWPLGALNDVNRASKRRWFVGAVVKSTAKYKLEEAVATVLNPIPIINSIYT